MVPCLRSMLSKQVPNDKQGEGGGGRGEERGEREGGGGGGGGRDRKGGNAWGGVL